MPAELLATYIVGGIGVFIVSLLVLAMVLRLLRRRKLFAALKACGMSGERSYKDRYTGGYKDRIYSVELGRHSVGLGITISASMCSLADMERVYLQPLPLFRVEKNAFGASLGNFLTGLKQVETGDIAAGRKYLVAARDTAKGREIMSKPEVAAALDTLFSLGFQRVELTKAELLAYNPRYGNRELTKEVLGSALDAFAALRPHLEGFGGKSGGSILAD